MSAIQGSAAAPRRRNQGLEATKSDSKLIAAVPTAALVTELVAFPTVVSIRQDNRLTIGLLLLLAAVGFVRRRREENAVNWVPFVLLMTCVGITFWRGPLTLSLLHLSVLVFLFVFARSTTRESAFSSLLAGLSLYLVANIIGWLLNISSLSTSVRIGEYETAEGSFFATRVFFPFCQSINEPAAVATVLIAAVVGLMRQGLRPRWYHGVGVISGIFVILASGSRGPLLIAMPLIALIYFAPRIVRIAAPAMTAIALLFPFLLTPAQSTVNWLAGVATENSFFGRGQSTAQLVNLSSRSEIWTKSEKYWLNFVTDWAHQLFGYGFLGHYTSGASASYAMDVEFLRDRSALTTHSAVLQALFDAGLVGAALFLASVLLIVVLYRANNRYYAMFAATLTLGTSSMLEAILSPGLSQTPFFLLLYLAVFAPRFGDRRRGRERDGSPTANPGSDRTVQI